MEKHFQIAEFPPHPFPEETPSPADPRPWGEPGARRQCVEEANKWGESAQGRRVSLPEVSVSTFRSRTRSEPANFTYALQYGRELRRMSDEFVSTFTDSKGLRISRSAGAIVNRVYRTVTTYLPGNRNSGGS
ncbi:bcl2-associated agonist of cell death-like isoform X2 [Narcine bancroftii]|uniref:bcl2-associated agonist of cell death-like isoform X2 n=1 Tax=Narcine bancroftii TaxID=1343680 RepID=UPI00383100D4